MLGESTFAQCSQNKLRHIDYSCNTVFVLSHIFLESVSWSSSVVEEVLPRVQTELPKLQFVPIAPCPVAGHH